MHQRTQELLDRSLNFGVTTLNFLARLKFNDILNVPKRQLARASVSIGANYKESQAAETKKDFIHKIGIVCKECRESHYWIRVLKAVYREKEIQQKLEEIQQEAMELRKIFTVIKMSAEGKSRTAHPPLTINP